MIYLIIFALVLVLAVLYQYTQVKFVKLLYSCLIIGILSGIAGLRDLGVGYDTSFYPVEVFDHVFQCNSIQEALEYSSEKLYVLLGFFISRFTDKITYFLFATHLIICTLFFVASVRYSQDNRIFLFIFLFLFLCYNQSINLSRQYIAIAIFIYSYFYLEQQKYIKYLIGIVIAMFFHSSAIICFIFLIIHRYRIYTNKKMFSLLIILILLFLFGYEKLLPIIINELGLSSRFLFYISLEGGFSYSEFLLRVSLICICLSGFITYYKRESFMLLFLMIIIIDFLLNLVQLNSRYANRISLYFFVLYLVYLPKMLMLCNFKVRIEKEIILYIICALYWFYVFYIQEAGHTIPYTSVILGIR